MDVENFSPADFSLHAASTFLIPPESPFWPKQHDLRGSTSPWEWIQKQRSAVAVLVHRA